VCGNKREREKWVGGNSGGESKDGGGKEQVEFKMRINWVFNDPMSNVPSLLDALAVQRWKETRLWEHHPQQSQP
jgi:hypothetical protein